MPLSTISRSATLAKTVPMPRNHRHSCFPDSETRMSTCWSEIANRFVTHDFRAENLNVSPESNLFHRRLLKWLDRHRIIPTFTENYWNCFFRHRSTAVLGFIFTL